tara:strand:+ start:2921 stop:3796 length:876 start_codon:yes stop_codon:yes gene_type:complete
MDFKKALDILEVSEPYTKKTLKKQYFKKALQHHPDKNSDPNSKTDFIEIREAYIYLSNSLNSSINDSRENDNYFAIIEQLFNLIKNSKLSSTKEIVNVILENCQMLSLSTFEKIDKQTALNIFGYIEKYSDTLCIDEDTVEKFREIIREKLQDDELIILNPSIDNLLNNDIYILDHKMFTYYIPLWHDEVTYETEGHTLFVKCIPQLPEHVYIDENNNIHVSIKIPIERALKDMAININLGEKVFMIPSSSLKVVSNQTHILSIKGIAVIDPNNNYNINKKGNISVHINLY